MNNENQNDIDRQISGYFEGNLTPDESAALNAWLSESTENQEYFRQLKNIHDSSAYLMISTKEAWGKVMERISPERESYQIWRILQRVAAIMLLPLLLSVIWLVSDLQNRKEFNKNHFFIASAAYGSYTSFELPDGSKVWLNSGSQLKYPAEFNSKSREVFLSGEAYFEVHADLAAPFYVNTPYFVVRATGTHFNVVAYKNYLYPSVTLLEGKVSVRSIKDANAQGRTTYLKPQQHLDFDTLTGNTHVQYEDTYKYIAWKDGKLVFRNDLLSEVASRISLQYNVDIQIVGDRIKHYRYRATFENEPLDELLRLLKLSAPIDYREIKPILKSDSSYTRRRIIIYANNK